MLFNEFDELPVMNQLEIIRKWEIPLPIEVSFTKRYVTRVLPPFPQPPVISFQKLCCYVSCLQWSVPSMLITSNIQNIGLKHVRCSIAEQILRIDYSSGLGRALRRGLLMYVEHSLRNYERFLLLSSSKGRVGGKSSLSRLPNELFYRVIELFITK